MNKSVLFAAMLGLVLAFPALGQIPEGYEVVQITSDPNYEYYPMINNCAEIVFSKRFGQAGDTTEVFRYDNGLVERITNNDVLDTLADINDAGTMVWTHGVWGDYYQMYIVTTSVDGMLWTMLGPGSSPVINNRGHVAWKYLRPEGCAAPSTILFWDGGEPVEIIDDGLSNQDVALNDHDELVWTRFDFCPDPYESDVMHFWGSRLTPEGPWPWEGQMVLNPPEMDKPQSASINNQGRIAWGYRDGDGDHAIVLWEDGDLTYLTDWGHGPRLNNVGDIAFARLYLDTELWQVWLYREGTFLQLTDDDTDNLSPEINDLGEIVWRKGVYPENDVFFMRRVRDGDVDLDGDVDTDDVDFLLDCWTGPVATDRLCDCRFCDLDHDRDVDDADLTTLQAQIGRESGTGGALGRRLKRPH